MNVGVCKRMFRSLDDLASTNHVSPYSTYFNSLLGIYLIALIEAYIGVDGGANHGGGKVFFVQTKLILDYRVLILMSF